MAKPRKFPEYDAETDGNVFEWIITEAALLHEKQAKENGMPVKKVDYLRRVAEKS